MMLPCRWLPDVPNRYPGPRKCVYKSEVGTRMSKPSRCATHLTCIALLLPPCLSSAQSAPPNTVNQAPSASPQSEGVAKTYTVPAGTKVLLSLKSGVNTKTAQPGDGVYLVSTFPVIVGSHVLIPTG